MKLAPSLHRQALGSPTAARLPGCLIQPGSSAQPQGQSGGILSTGCAAAPQRSLAPVQGLLSRSVPAYSDPIRPFCRHGAISQDRRPSARPSLCRGGEATHETFPPFPALLSLRATHPTSGGPSPRPVVLGRTIPGFLAIRPESPPPRPPLPAVPSGCRSWRSLLRIRLRPAGLPRPPGWRRHGKLVGSRCFLRTMSPALSSPMRHGIKDEGQTRLVNRKFQSLGFSPVTSRQVVKLHPNGQPDGQQRPKTSISYR